MKRSIFTFLLGATVLSAVGGCGNSASGGTREAQPFRDEWREVINQPFSTFDAEGAVNIGSLQIGGTESSDNFANRGDVIVEFADTDRIIVEMRKFTMADSQELADADFDKLSIWASTGNTPPPPFNLDEEDNCLDPDGVTEWQDGCQVRVFYDGQTQVARSGADLRVTIPNDFIYDLTVVTEDNDEDADYQNRGNVCVQDLPGSADISLANGEAFVILDEGMNEMPECPAADVQTCIDVGWDASMCPCLINSFSFSQTKVTALDAQASSATVDMPSGGNFWVGYSLRNDGDNDPNDDSGPGALCTAVVEDSVGSIAIDDSIDLDQNPSSNRGAINYPGEPATVGAGYSIQLTSDACADVQGTEDPSDFVGVGNGSEQESAERGNLSVCAGCLRASSCRDLLGQ